MASMAASSLLQLPPLLLPLLLLPSVFAAPRALSSSRPSPAKCATALNQIASGPRLARSPAACSLVAGRQQALLRASNCSHEDISAFCGWLAPPRCVSRLVLVRHGEKSRDDSDKNLTLDGQHRAAYLARCAAVGGSAALALGAPTAIMASAVRPGKSHRPRDTVQPLATALGLSIDLSVDKEDPAAFAAAVQRKLTCNGTLLVAWQHQDVPSLVQALAPPNAADYADWPLQCSGPYWPEPPYIKKTSACYVRATHTHSHSARSESVSSDAAFSLSSPDVVGRCVWLVDRIAFG
jgi:hypothetical protein